MDINDLKHLAVERIYLIPDSSEGQLGYVWCDDPAPGEGMDAAEAVEYVRKDVADARIAELEVHVERLDNELQEKALTDDGVLADAYWNCADKITPWLGEKTGPDTLINSVAQSLEFLIEQWREKKIIEQERDAYRTAEEAQIALRQKMEGERDALAADRADLIK